MKNSDKGFFQIIFVLIVAFALFSYSDEIKDYLKNLDFELPDSSFMPEVGSKSQVNSFDCGKTDYHTKLCDIADLETRQKSVKQNELIQYLSNSEFDLETTFEFAKNDQFSIEERSFAIISAAQNIDNADKSLSRYDKYLADAIEDDDFSPELIEDIGTMLNSYVFNNGKEFKLTKLSKALSSKINAGEDTEYAGYTTLLINVFWDLDESAVELAFRDVITNHRKVYEKNPMTIFFLASFANEEGQKPSAEFNEFFCNEVQYGVWGDLNLGYFQDEICKNWE
jgi:hypothetical protein